MNLICGDLTYCFKWGYNAWHGYIYSDKTIHHAIIRYNHAMKRRFLYITFIILSLFSLQAHAILHLMLTQGVSSAIPMNVIPFEQKDASIPTTISSVISADLQNSGRFKNVAVKVPTKLQSESASKQQQFWQNQRISYVITGSIESAGNDQYKIEFDLQDVYKKIQKGGNPNVANQLPGILSQTFTISSSQLRQLGHHISDLIYQQILGVKGVFSTKIAYVVLNRGTSTSQAPVYKLIIADYDGVNPQEILQSNQPIMSPNWSPDGSQLAYVSFENGAPNIYISNIVTGKRRLITNFPGINGAPAFSPDGTQLAVVLSKGRQPNIYIVNLSTGNLRQLTRDYAINTEPSWAPDGQSLLYTSDRGGSPQIYQYNLRTRQSKRLTFDGNYNAHANFDPAAGSLVMLHRGADSDHKFSVALQDLKSGVLQVLANNNAQSPSIAPNGSMVLYAIQTTQGQDELAMVSTDGRVQIKLPSGDGDVREPVWSPYLSGN